MHNNYYFLEHLTPDVKQKLMGFKLVACFSQNKNELILSFSKDHNVFFIKAYLSPSFCCLSFPQTFHRARKNSVDIFTPIHHQEVIDIYQYQNERAFSIKLTQGWEIVFKLHGNRSNILFAQHDQVIAIFNNKLIKDTALVPSQLDRPIDQSYENFIRQKNIATLFPTFGKEVMIHLKNSGFDDLNEDTQWELVQNMIDAMRERKYFVSYQSLSLLPTAYTNVYHDPITALNEFFTQYISTSHLTKEKNEIQKVLKVRLQKGKSYIKKTSEKLAEITTNTSYRVFGDIIMANLHNIPDGIGAVTLQNLYNENLPVTIPLKKTLNAQKNAEVFYRKAKNQTKEIDNLKHNVIQKEVEIDQLNAHLSAIDSLDDFRSFKTYLTENNLTAKTKEEKVTVPYHIFHSGDFIIWVGKHARANDKMLQMTHKNDLWLHAKDVAGSHIIVKYRSEQPYSSTIKEKAAQLAAYYSKRRTDSLCPVIVTPRKFVRKRKGDPPGKVLIDKEMEILLVQPAKWSNTN